MKLIKEIKYNQIIKRFYPKGVPGSGGGGSGKKMVEKILGTANPPTNVVPPVQNNNQELVQQQTANNNPQINNIPKEINTQPQKIPGEIKPVKYPQEILNRFPNSDKIESEIEKMIETVFAEDIAKFGLSKNDVRKKLTDIWNQNPVNYDSNMMKDWIDKIIFQPEIEKLASTLEFFYTNNLNNFLSKKFINMVFEIEEIENFLKKEPHTLNEIVGEIADVHQELEDIIREFCKQYDKQIIDFTNYKNHTEYRKIYPKGLNLLCEEQIYTHNAIFGSYNENLNTKDQLKKNIETLTNIKNSMVIDQFLSIKQLIEIAKKLCLVEYRDVRFYGKEGDLYELIDYTQKQAGQTVLNVSVESDIVHNDLPNIQINEIIEILTTKKFYALDIDINSSKFDELFIPSGVTAHTCIAIDYKGKKLILGYLTSTTNSPKISDFQLYNKTKTQHLCVLNNLCIEENHNIKHNKEIQKYLENPEIQQKMINVFSSLLKEAINKPIINTPIITIQNLKDKIIEKVEQQLQHYQIKLKKYENVSEKLENKDKKKKLHFIIDHLNLNLHDEAKRILTWYLDMEKRKKILDEKELIELQKTYKEKNNNNIKNNNDQSS